MKKKQSKRLLKSLSNKTKNYYIRRRTINLKTRKTQDVHQVIPDQETGPASGAKTSIILSEIAATNVDFCNKNITTLPHKRFLQLQTLSTKTTFKCKPKLPSTNHKASSTILTSQWDSSQILSFLPLYLNKSNSNNINGFLLVD
jgi:hypothetical protein